MKAKGAREFDRIGIEIYLTGLAFLFGFKEELTMIVSRGPSSISCGASISIAPSTVESVSIRNPPIANEASSGFTARNSK